MTNLRASFNVDRCFKQLAMQDPGNPKTYVDSDGTTYIYEWIPGDRVFHIHAITTTHDEKWEPLNSADV